MQQKTIQTSLAIGSIILFGCACSKGDGIKAPHTISTQLANDLIQSTDVLEDTGDHMASQDVASIAQTNTFDQVAMDRVPSIGISQETKWLVGSNSVHSGRSGCIWQYVKALLDNTLGVDFRAYVSGWHLDMEATGGDHGPLAHEVRSNQNHGVSCATMVDGDSATSLCKALLLCAKHHLNLHTWQMLKNPDAFIDFCKSYDASHSYSHKLAFFPWHAGSHALVDVDCRAQAADLFGSGPFYSTIYLAYTLLEGLLVYIQRTLDDSSLDEYSTNRPCCPTLDEYLSHIRCGRLPLLGHVNNGYTGSKRRVTVDDYNNMIVEGDACPVLFTSSKGCYAYYQTGSVYCRIKERGYGYHDHALYVHGYPFNTEGQFTPHGDGVRAVISNGSCVDDLVKNLEDKTTIHHQAHRVCHLDHRDNLSKFLMPFVNYLLFESGYA